MHFIYIGASMVKCKLCYSKNFKKNHHSIVHCIRLSTHGFSLCCDLRVRVIVERALESSFQALKIDGSLDGLFNQPRFLPTQGNHKCPYPSNSPTHWKFNLPYLWLVKGRGLWRMWIFITVLPLLINFSLFWNLMIYHSFHHRSLSRHKQ